MSMYVHNATAATSPQYYQFLDRTLHLSMLLNLKNPADVEALLARNYPNRVYHEEIALEVSEASETIRNNILIIRGKFPNIIVVCRKDLDNYKLCSIAAMLESLIQPEQEVQA